VIASAAVPIPTKNGNSKSESSTGNTAIMDQVDRRFEPEVLVVRTGTSVSFPNSDSIAHQVYSFSPAKRFTLPLYRGRVHPPLLFDQPGVVVLGCNIHDQMIGYIVVTNSPYFGMTDEHGRAVFASLPAGNYRVSLWHPRFDESVPDQELRPVDTGATDVTFRLQRALRPKPKQSGDRIRDY
jgi:plastocyanin